MTVRERAGLLVVDKFNNICLIQQHKPYSSTTPGPLTLIDSNSIDYTGSLTLRPLSPTIPIFLEAIQIPRGCKEKNDKSLLDAAKREFLEETHCSNKNVIFIYKKPFVLFWYDDNRKWEYTIYIGFLDDEFKFKNTSNKSKCLIYNKYPYTLIKCLNSHSIIVMKLNDYIYLLKDIQLKHYHLQHNYYEFINYLCKLQIPFHGIINTNWISLKMI